MGQWHFVAFGTPCITRYGTLQSNMETFFHTIEVTHDHLTVQIEAIASVSVLLE